MQNTIKPQALLQPIKIGSVSLKNRIIMAPMTRSRADNEDRAATDLHAEYYAQRASAGLIISEGSQVSEMAVGYVFTPGIYSAEQVKGWKKVTEAVHQKNGKIFCQLWHVGRISHPDFHNGNKPLAPSALNPHSKSRVKDGFKDTVTPKEMTSKDIKETIADFKNAAKNSKEAGFDGIEIHSSNGYLFHQFFNRSSNKREDEYGGSIEKRAKFLFDVLDEVIEVLGAGKVGIRLNPSLDGIFGMEADKETIPTFEYIVKKLNDYNLAYLHLSEPFNDVSKTDYLVSDIAKHFRPLYNGNLMISTDFNREKGNKVIEDGDADLVSFGKLFISNPDLPKRFELNAELNEWDQETFYQGGRKGYTDYALLGEDKVNNGPHSKV